MTGTIPQSFIDELILRTDIVELIDSYVPLKKAGTNFTCCCPFHQEKTASFNVIPHKQFFYCFGCGTSGNVIKFLMQFLQITFPEAIKQLAQQLGLSLPEIQQFNELSSSSQLVNLLDKINQFYRKNLYQKPPQLIEYIKNRKLNKTVIDQFELGYAPAEWQNLTQLFPKEIPLLIEGGMIIQKENQKQYFDRFRHRLMFPLHNRQGKLIGFAGRVIDKEQKPKYMNSPETSLFHKQKELYGLYHVLNHQKNPEFILVVEGYLDVISLFQFGLPNAVATMGTATSYYHLQTLHKYTERIIFCFDGDPAGRQAAWRALENALPMYNQLAHIDFLFLPDGHDPDSYIREFGLSEFQNLIQKSQNLHSYFAQELYQQYGKSGTQRLIQEVQKYLSKLEDGPGKELILREISQLTRLETYRIAQWLEQPQTMQNSPTLKQTTPIRLAMALIIQNPGLYKTLPEPLLKDIALQSPEPFGLIFETLQAQSHLTTASLVEYFRDTQFYEAFNKLAIFDHQIHEDKQSSTLIEIFEFLVKQSLTDEIEQLIQKLKTQGLDDEQKYRLQQLLRRRQVQKM
jgi:DNA primase